MSESTALIKRLKQFNAKERYWLVRQATGGFSPNENFLKAIVEAASLPRLQVANVADVYMAMDYHLNWIHAALSGRERDDTSKWPENPSVLSRCEKMRRAVEGNQEDVDLLVAYPARDERGEFTQLIFVEAKCGGTFADEQLRSKFDRLALILESSRQLPFFFDARVVLMSPSDPRKMAKWFGGIVNDYPSVLPDGLRWMQLDIGPEDREGFWMVRPQRAPGVRPSGAKPSPADWTHWSLSRRPGTQRNVPDPQS